MNARKVIGVSLLALGIFGICSAEGCPPDTGKADKAAVVKCTYKDNPKYKKASFKEKRAKGVFFTCGGAKCVVTVRFPDTGKGVNRSSDIHTVGKYKYPTTFTVPKNAKNFSSSHCGTIYKMVLKKA